MGLWWGSHGNDILLVFYIWHLEGRKLRRDEKWEVQRPSYGCDLNTGVCVCVCVCVCTYSHTHVYIQMAALISWCYAVMTLVFIFWIVKLTDSNAPRPIFRWASSHFSVLNITIQRGPPWPYNSDSLVFFKTLNKICNYPRSFCLAHLCTAFVSLSPERVTCPVSEVLPLTSAVASAPGRECFIPSTVSWLPRKLHHGLTGPRAPCKRPPNGLVSRPVAVLFYGLFYLWISIQEEVLSQICWLKGCQGWWFSSFIHSLTHPWKSTECLFWDKPGRTLRTLIWIVYGVCPQ